MSMEVTEITIVKEGEDYFLNDMTLKIKHKNYIYLQSKIYLKVMDARDNNIVNDKLYWDSSDDLLTTGCDDALEKGRVMNIKIQIDTKMPRTDLDKTFIIKLESKRDPKTGNILEIRKTFKRLKIPGAKYT